MPKKDAVRPSTEPISSDAARPAFEAFAIPTETFAPSPAKPTREDPEARWKGFYKDRWERRRELLPNLKLKYPDDDEQACIAQLAGAKNTPAFAEGIRSIILDAHLGNQQFHTLSVPEVKTIIKNVAERAKALKDALTQLDVASGSEGSFMEAGYLLEAELFGSESQITQLPEYMVLLDALNAAAERAAGKPMSFPRGAGGNPAFDMCIEQLLIIAWLNGGRWTNYRSKEGSWTGTLLKVLKILKKYLPQSGFFPPGEVGRSVDHIKNKLAQHIARYPGLSGDDQANSMI
jgi:hypothetical protein